MATRRTLAKGVWMLSGVQLAGSDVSKAKSIHGSQWAPIHHSPGAS